MIQLEQLQPNAAVRGILPDALVTVVRVQWSVIANLKTAMRGTYHHFNFAKYRARYLAEAQYRLNRRFDLASIVERVLGACVLAPPSPEAWLRRGEVRSH
jgi:hypothetical protein